MRNLYCFLLLAFGPSLHAQADPISAVNTLDANNVRATLGARGELFSVHDVPELRAHAAGASDAFLARGGGLWIIGRDSLGALTGAVQGFRTIPDGEPSDFVPGPIGAVDLNYVFSVSCGNIQQHLADLADNGTIDTPQPGVLGWPGIGNGYFSAIHPDLGALPFTSAGLAGFYDANGSGLYDPEQGDYPSIDFRGCANDIYPNQDVFTVSNDQKIHTLSGLKPLNLEVQTQAFAFRVMPAASVINNTIFVRYKLIYLGVQPVDSVYLGLWTDFSLGALGIDDYAGTAPAHDMLYGYDHATGLEPKAALGVVMLRGPLELLPPDTIVEVPLRHLMIVDQLPAAGNGTGFYNLLRGRFADGTPAPNNGVLFPGNPNDPAGASEITAGTTPGNRHGVASYGPFRLYPGAVNELIVAYFHGYAPGVPPLEQVQFLYDSVGVIENAMASCFQNLGIDCLPLVDAPEPAAPVPARLYPNPAGAVCIVERPGAAFARLEIFDVAGRQLRHLTIPNPVDRFELPLAALPAGFYTVRIDGRQSLPLVVQR